MISSTLPNKSFIRTSTLFTINGRLVDRYKVSGLNVIKIQNLQSIRLYFYDLINISNDKDEIRHIGRLLTQLEFQLQKLWGFELDKNKHRCTDIPKCSCDIKSDFTVIYKSDCLVHGINI